ncbi:MAG: FtsQ-type POTRA domain-containing protein [Spirochaetales bacterium]|nr:FtsQ-type POTRA domain-containing protein [Spirochaetales bacterium]
MNRTLVFSSVRKEKKKDGILSKILWGIIVILFVILVVEIIFQFFIAPGLLIRNILVESEIPITNEAIMRLAGIRNSEYYFSLDTDMVKQRLEEYSLIREAVVEKNFPETLKIKLYARSPLAVTFIRNNDATIPAMIDENGVVFNIGKIEDTPVLPVISGITFQDYREGMVLPGKITGLFQQMNKLRKSFPVLFDIISEIKIISINEADYELVIYPVPYTNRIRMGNRLNGNELKYAIMVLDVLKEQDSHNKISEIDFRTKEIVYKYAEGEIN